MGNCGSKPPVEDDKPAPKFTPPPARNEVPATPPSQAKPTLAASQPISSEEKRDVAQARKSKSMEIPPPVRPDVQFHTPQPGGDSDKDSDEEDARAGGEWKVRRRVSRRLSLEVQKKPGSKAGSPSPSWGPAPTAEEQSSWDAAADADLMGPVEVKTYTPPTQEGQGFQKGLHANVAGEHAQSRTATAEPVSSVGGLGGRSRLGPGVAGATVNDDGSDDEGQGAKEEMPGPWKVRRRGRRLSLEVEHAPDLALLAALRRSSSAPLVGEYARKAAQDDKEVQRQEEYLQQMAPAPVKVPVSPTLSSKVSGESAVSSPAAHSAMVIDFAQKLTVDVGGDADVEEVAVEETRDTPSSVKMAEFLAQGTPNGSPDQFRARRRKSRRLSLEIEKQPEEAVLAAVRRTHSAPVTAASAQAAMGDAAWAAAMAGTGGVDSGSQSPKFQPKAAARGADARDRATAGGDLVPSATRVATSAQEARANAWGNAKIIDFAAGSAEDEDDDDDDSTLRDGQADSSTGYVRVNPRATSRRRSMDIYKKAVSEGQTHDSAAELARKYDPNFTSYEKAAAAEEADLMGPDEAGSATDFSTWSGSAAQPKPAFKNRWADYKATNTEPETSDTGRYPDMSAFGNEPQPGAPSPLAGISV